jgi:hypothetical protein
MIYKPRPLKEAQEDLSTYPLHTQYSLGPADECF